MTYRRIRFGQIGDSKVIRFAVQELVSYLKKMDAKLVIDVLKTDKIQEAFEQIIWVGLDDTLLDKVPMVNEPVMDDAIAIEVEGGHGYITGSNERSVLLAVYRFLKSLGCEWVRPGAEGERIPQKAVEDVNVSICEAASYRYRGVCIEGANTYENVFDMIDYLPKTGMNAYYIQGMEPFHLASWYRHGENAYLEKEIISRQEIVAMGVSLEEEIAQRGISYHKTGHGWTTPVFGIHAIPGCTDYEEQITEEARQALAMIEGKRGLWKNHPAKTNLCYSNSRVREKMTDAIVEYCKENPQVDVLHFWLADENNNHCECEKCVEKRPADWYLILLNELDEKMNKAGLDTKVVFLVYQDLMWEPVAEELNNHKRFILMFAPYDRNFGQNFSDYLSYDKEIPPYVRNKLTMPKSLSQSLAHLRRWQQKFKGDSFDFDYYLMWAHLNDPGYEYCARNIFEDMKDLDKIGLNGMVSCQVQRSFFPTALPFYMMAAALWDKECAYEEKVTAYYKAAFGEDGELVHRYLGTISELLLLYNGPFYVDASSIYGPFCKDYDALKKVVAEFLPVIKKHVAQVNRVYREEWEFLELHSEYLTLIVKSMELLEQHEDEKAKKNLDELLDFMARNELTLQKVFDSFNANGHWGRSLNSYHFKK